LNELKGDPRHDSRDERVVKLHLGVRYNQVEDGEQQDDQRERDDIQQPGNNGIEDVNRLERLVLGIVQDSERVDQDEENGYEQYHRRVVGHLPGNTSPSAHLPYLVEVGLDVVKEEQDGVEKQKDTDPGEQAPTLGLFQGVVDRLQQDVEKLMGTVTGTYPTSYRLTGHHFRQVPIPPGHQVEEATLHDILYAKSPGDGENNGQQWHDGE